MNRKKGIPKVGDAVWYEDPAGINSDVYWVQAITDVDKIYHITDWKNGSGKSIFCTVEYLTLE